MLLAYFAEQKPQLALHEYFTEGIDEGFIITARNMIKDAEIETQTKEYCSKHFNALQLIMVNAPENILKGNSWALWAKSNESWDNWRMMMAQAKADAINRLKINYYFEDVLPIAKHLRKACPQCITVHYGGKRF